MESAFSSYFLEFGKGLFALVATLLPIMNPPSGAALFLSVTSGASAATRHMLAKGVARNCFLMLIAFILLGSFVLKMFGISKEIVLIGGGLLVVKMGWGLVNAEHVTPKHDEQLADTQSAEKILQTAFFPLSFPMTVGPGVLAASLTLGVSFTGSTDGSLSMLIARLLGGLAGITILALTVRVCYGYAEKLMSMIGETGAIVFLRICAFILLCIGIQLIWDGLSSAVTNLYVTLSDPATHTLINTPTTGGDLLGNLLDIDTNTANPTPSTPPAEIQQPILPPTEQPVELNVPTQPTP